MNGSIQRPLRIRRVACVAKAFPPIMQSGDLSPRHRVTPSILAKPIESQPAEITQLFLSQPLRDPEWAAWSDSEIGRRCLVSHRFVAKMREQLTGPHHETFQDEQPRTVRRRGTTYTQNICRIGNSRKAKARQAEVRTDVAAVPASASAATKTRTAAVQ